MAKRRNLSGRTLRNAVPQPRDVAEFVAPRTVNEGLSVKHVFGDVGDMIDPFITAAIEKQEGLRDVSDDELKMLAALGSIPVVSAVAGKLTKKLNKLVPNPKGGFIRIKSGKEKLKDIIEASNEAGYTITPQIEKEIKDHIGLMNGYQSGNVKGKIVDNHYDRMSNEAKQVIDAYKGLERLPRTMHKPKGFDDLPPQERIKIFENKAAQLGTTKSDLDQLYKNAMLQKDATYGKNNRDLGSIYEDYFNLDDYNKARYELEKELPKENTVKLSRPESWNAVKTNTDDAKLRKAEEKARREAEKEARWKAEREAAAKKAEEVRLAREAEQARIAKEAEEAEAQRIAEEERIAREEAERRAQEEEFERQFREEEAAERNRYADSVGTALGMEAVNRDIDDWLLEKMIAEEEATAANRPIEMVQVMQPGEGILHAEGVAPQGGRRNTYDHSRQFMDTELKRVPGIDRTGMSYGDDTDAFFDIYKTWREARSPAEASRALYALKSEARAGKTRNSAGIRGVDPYYAAGVVGNKNFRLWSKINELRGQGKTDVQIRELLKDDLNKYQGDIERLKERMPSKGHGSQFEYDGATTLGLKAVPSEEARALKALGIDTPEYDELERLGNFYRVFFPK